MQSGGGYDIQARKTAAWGSILYANFIIIRDIKTLREAAD